MNDRQSRRKPGFDYSTPGFYFITIRVQNSEMILSRVINQKLYLFKAGLMVEKWWKKIPQKFKWVLVDKFIVMPNHIHGILILRGHSKTENSSFNLNSHDKKKDSPLHTTNPTVSTIVQWFKTMTTNEYIKNIKTNNWKRFDKKLWHRNFYDHIIKNRNELIKIRNYITNNPANWKRQS